MERIEYWVTFSIRRGLAFASLAIVTTLVGFLDQPVFTLKLAAVLIGLVAASLALMALNAPTRAYRRTEVWLLLDRRHDLPESRAQAIIGGIRRRIFLRHALGAALLAGICLLLAWVLAFPAPP